MEVTLKNDLQLFIRRRSSVENRKLIASSISDWSFFLSGVTLGNWGMTTFPDINRSVSRAVSIQGASMYVNGSLYSNIGVNKPD